MAAKVLIILVTLEVFSTSGGPSYDCYADTGRMECRKKNKLLVVLKAALGIARAADGCLEMTSVLVGGALTDTGLMQPGPSGTDDHLSLILGKEHFGEWLMSPHDFPQRRHKSD